MILICMIIYLTHSKAHYKVKLFAMLLLTGNHSSCIYRYAHTMQDIIVQVAVTPKRICFIWVCFVMHIFTKALIFFSFSSVQLWKPPTCFLNCWHSSGVRVSALAISGMTLTFSCNRFMNSMSKGFNLHGDKDTALHVVQLDTASRVTSFWVTPSKVPCTCTDILSVCLAHLRTK